MKKTIGFLLCVVLLISGCAYYEKEEAPEGEPYGVYFLARDLDSVIGDGALQPETIYLREETLKDTCEAATLLMKELLRGPLGSHLDRPIPVGTTLQSMKMEGSRAVVDLSSEYISLSGVELTLADYAVTLTLTQLPEILSVKITVDGQELAYREQQILTARDVRLAPQGDVVSTVEASLYFLNQENVLVKEERVLELYEGDTQVMVVARALENDAENKELSSPFPEGFRVKSVWLEEHICYVNLSSVLLENLPFGGAGVQRAIQALGQSLCSLESVDETRFLVDGEFAGTYGLVDLSEPYVG